LNYVYAQNRQYIGYKEDKNDLKYGFWTVHFF
jgi:hypothetical protein